MKGSDAPRKIACHFLFDHHAHSLEIKIAIPAAEITYHPQLSAFQWAAARMGWSLADVETLTAHGRPAEQVIPWFWPFTKVAS